MVKTTWVNNKAQSLAAKYGTPLYAYDIKYLENRAKNLFDLCHSRGWVLRYALKANPHREIIKLFEGIGLCFDASSEFEAADLLKLGIKPNKISLSSQQPPGDLKGFLENGVLFTATSLHQLELISKTGWKGEIAVRLNPGVGAGGTNRTATGGLNASFGIWHEYIPKILDGQKRSSCRINRIHIHIGSGYDPKIWEDTIKAALNLVKLVPSVNILNMGGGFKVARMPSESEADMPTILEIFNKAVREFYKQTGRKIQIEIEPGTWLVANGGTLLSRVVDITDTGAKGFTFLKLDTGMNDFLRPAMYGSQHPIEVLNNATDKQDYLVVGHNCETGDILTPAPGNPEGLQTRQMNQARIGDLVAIGGAGAYGASMRAIGYNSFPSAKEICFKT